MVRQSSDPRAEFQRLRRESQRLRAESVRTRIETALSFCAIAEHDPRPDCARTQSLLSHIRHSIEELQWHITEPDHLSEEAARDLGQRLIELKRRADRLENPQ